MDVPVNAVLLPDFDAADVISTVAGEVIPTVAVDLEPTQLSPSFPDDDIGNLQASSMSPLSPAISDLLDVDSVDDIVLSTERAIIPYTELAPQAESYEELGEHEAVSVNPKLATTMDDDFLGSQRNKWRKHRDQLKDDVYIANLVNESTSLAKEQEEFEKKRLCPPDNVTKD